MILDDLKTPNPTYDILGGGSRIGGRVYTHHFGDEPHDYYHTGAMRYPDIPTMKRTLEHFKLTKMPPISYYPDGESNCPRTFGARLLNPDMADLYHASKKNGGCIPNDVDNI